MAFLFRLLILVALFEFGHSFAFAQDAENKMIETYIVSGSVGNVSAETSGFAGSELVDGHLSIWKFGSTGSKVDLFGSNGDKEITVAPWPGFIPCVKHPKNDPPTILSNIIIAQIPSENQTKFDAWSVLQQPGIVSAEVFPKPQPIDLGCK